MSIIINLVITIFLGYMVLKILKWLVDYISVCLVVNKIPGPFMLPFVGNALCFSASGFMQELAAISKRYLNYSIFRLWIGPHFWIVLHKPEQLEVYIYLLN